MRTLSKILGACAILALAGSAAWAASPPAQHRLTVWLPGGGSEVISYAGNVVPEISFTPADVAPVSFWSPIGFNAMPVDPIAAAMDADMASMIQRADAMMAMPMMIAPFNGVSEANLEAMAPGSQSYSVVSTMNGNNVCTQSVEITSSGHGKPQVLRHSSGNCAAMPDNSVLFHLAPGPDNHLMTVKSTVPQFAPAYPHI